MFFRETIFRGKATMILEKEFGYDPTTNYGNRHVLRESSKQMRRNGGNEFDAAIAFMYLTIGSLSNSRETIEFRLKNAKKALELAHFSILDTTRDMAPMILAEIEAEAEGYFQG